MSFGIVKSPHGYYKIRLRVPLNLTPYFNRTEINKSLKTKSKVIAQASASSLFKEFSQIKLYASTKLITEEQLKDLIKHFMYDSLGMTQGLIKSKPQLTKPNHTYKKLIQQFKVYYQAKDISETTRENVIKFLEDVFMYLIGAKTVIHDTTFEDLIKIKEIIAELPNKNRKGYRLKTTAQLLKMNIPIEDRLSTGRVQSCINQIKLFYRFCMARQIITYNPSEFITVPSDVGQVDEREAYTKEEVSKLLDLVDELSNPLAEPLYYSLIYSGMRVSELWKCTIHEVNGVWCFDLTSKKIKLKTKASYRLIPIHDEILRRGYHLKVKEALTGYIAKSLSRHYRDRLRDHVSNNPKKVLYSVRHAFATELKYARIDPHVISELMGHSHGGMTMGRYASRYPVEVLDEAVGKLIYTRS